jgi:hypothetical protein
MRWPRAAGSAPTMGGLGSDALTQRLDAVIPVLCDFLSATWDIKYFVFLSHSNSGNACLPSNLHGVAAFPSFCKPGHEWSGLIRFVFRQLQKILRHFSEIYLGFHEGRIEVHGYAEFGSRFGLAI